MVFRSLSCAFLALPDAGALAAAPAAEPPVFCAEARASKVASPVFRGLAGFVRRGAEGLVMPPQGSVDLEGARRAAPRVLT